MKYQTIIFTDFVDTTLSVKPLGAYKIASELRRAGFSCLVIDCMSVWSMTELKNLLDNVMNHDTLFVAFSTTFFMSTQDVEHSPKKYQPLVVDQSFAPQGAVFETELVTEIKNISPGCKIVLGGYKASPECRNPNVDIIVKGLAEVSVVHLAQDLERGRDLRNATKTIWKKILIDLDQTDLYDFAAANVHWQDIDVVNARVLPFEPARGCIFNCKFCSFPHRGKKTLDYVLSAELIYDQLYDTWIRHGIDTYQLMDDTFNDSDEKMQIFVDVVKQLPFKPKFWAYNRLDLLASKPHRIDRLIDIGVQATSFGIESLNVQAGRAVGKGLDAQRQINTIRDIRKNYGDKILMHGLFIIGLPHESTQDIISVRRRILDQDIPLHSAYFESLYIRRPWTSWNLSEFDINFKKYGYQDNGTTNGIWVDWSNDQMDFSEASALRDETMQMIWSGEHMHIPGQTLWSLMNYPRYDFDSLRKKKNRELDWHQISKSKEIFGETYKKNLKKLVIDDGNKVD